MFEWGDQLKEMTLFLNKDSSIGQRLYHFWFNENEIPKCPYCDESLKFNDRGKFSLDKGSYYANYNITCGNEACKVKHESNVKKKIQAEIRSNPEKRKLINEKTRLNNIKKYGVEWYVKSKDFLKKSEQTCFNNHGVLNGAKSKRAKELSKTTCLKKYGVEHYFQSVDAKQKTEQFYLNLGVSHNTHIPEIFDKMTRKGYKRKDFILPSGKIVKVQGYEYITLNRLFLEGYKETDVIIGNRNIQNYIGVIKYETFDGKVHRYYPDVFIKSLNKIIEVKSTYTFKCDRIKNELKKQACEDAGFLFEFDVHEKPKNKYK